jgi:FKBP-type peptidyl-prolyl cis-trans isomerase 2
MESNKNKLLIFCIILLIVFSIATVQGEEQKGEKNMTISDGKRVSLEYTISFENKEIVDTNKGKEPLIYVQGADQIFPILEKNLEGLAVGQTKEITLTPEEAYGQRVEGAILEIDKEQLPPDSQQVGALVQGQNQSGQVFQGKIVEIKEDKAVVDLNHPLAGKTLIYEIKIIDIQDN